MNLDFFILYNLVFIGVVYICAFICTFLFMRKWGRSNIESIFISLKFVFLIFIISLLLFIPFAVLFVLSGVWKL